MSADERDAELVLDARADLGEGPTWDAEARLLVWVDIPAGLVHRFDPETGRDEALDVAMPVGAAVPTTSGMIALAARDGFALLDPATGRVDRLVDVEADVPGTMMNDGACDARGRFWAGTKDLDGRRPAGSLYRLGTDHRVTRILSGVTISNGIGWSPDQATMYYVDSPTHGVDAFDFDVESGDVSRRRRLVAFPVAWGLPDGMTVDAEGSLWVAFWGGSAVRRIDPDGRVAAAFRFPVSQVSSCAFGGTDLSELYVTSARSGLTRPELEAEPHAGSVFRVLPGVQGRADHPFAG